MTECLSLQLPTPTIRSAGLPRASGQCHLTCIAWSKLTRRREGHVLPLSAQRDWILPRTREPSHSLRSIGLPIYLKLLRHLCPTVITGAIGRGSSEAKMKPRVCVSPDGRSVSDRRLQKNTGGTKTRVGRWVALCPRWVRYSTFYPPRCGVAGAFYTASGGRDPPAIGFCPYSRQSGTFGSWTCAVQPGGH